MRIENIEQMHRCQLDILSAFDTICKRNGIQYFVFEGTLLGAARHKDFIPWDDDTDVALLREDYDKLLALPESEYPENLKLYYPEEADNFLDFIPRIVDINHEGERNNIVGGGSNPFAKHPFIDLFVLDNSYGGLKQRMRVLIQKVLFVMARGHRKDQVALDPAAGPQIVKIRLLIRPIEWFGRLLPVEKERKWYKSLSKRCKKGKALYSSNIALYSLHQEYDPSWFGGAAALEIRGLKVPAPEGYKEILEMRYGNYMELPPAELRKPFHFVFRDDSE